MLEKEYWWKEMVDIVTNDDKYSFGVDIHTKKPCKCNSLVCDNCLFYNNCRTLRNKWANSEHIEPIKLTLAEKIILENIDSNFKWIAKHNNNEILCFEKNPYKFSDVWYGSCFRYLPFKQMFKFIRLENDEPYKIKDILNNCEIVDDEV